METQAHIPLRGYLAENFQLTRTELQICLHLSAGNCRDDLRRLLGLSEDALKFHLKNIFSKTLSEEVTTRDKLHRLAALMWQIREKCRSGEAAEQHALQHASHPVDLSRIATEP